MKHFIAIFSLFLSVFLLNACSTTDYAKEEEKMTIAKAQREIKVGMSSSDVVEVLGSPNMVTTDEKRRETWVYDKVSTQVSSSSAKSGVWLLIAFTGSKETKASSNQRTLTIIVKFDESSKVRDFAYRTSTF